MSLYTEILFSGLSLEDGLSNSSVTAIIQDRLGFMWFGTQDGLNRYDGYDFVVYRNEVNNKNCLSNNFVNSLYEDSFGELWIGTENGLNRYDREKDNFKKYENSEFKKIIKSNKIRAIFEDSEKNLWIGTYGDGLICLNSKREFKEHFEYKESDPNSISGNRVLSVIQDHQGNIWAGTWGKGINLLEKEKNSFQRFMNDPSTDCSLSENKVDSMYCDSDGNVWAGTTNGLNKYVKELNGFKHFNHDPEDIFSISNRLLSNMCEDKQGRIWVGTKEGGLNLFDRAEEKFYHFKKEKGNPYSLGNNSVMKIYFDRSGILWIGTFGSGVKIYRNHSKKFNHFIEKQSDSNSLCSNSISCFAEDNCGCLYIGHNDNGITKYQSEKNQFIRYTNNKENDFPFLDFTINCLIPDENGIIWLGTNGFGLVKFDTNNKESKCYSSKLKNDNTKNSLYIFSLLKDEDGFIWYGTAGKGICRFDPINEEILIFSFNPDDINDESDKRIRKIIKRDNDTLILGSTFGGLIFFDKVKKKFEQYKNDPKDQQSISNNFITDIVKTSNGDILAGTFESGLNILKTDKNGQYYFKRVTKNDGLPNNSINGILEDEEGNYWISTNKGISKMNTKRNLFKNYDDRDGLQSNEFNPWACLKLSSGEFAYGGINGFNLFNPADINDNLVIPEIVITDFKIFNKEVPFNENGSILKKTITMTNEIELSYKESVFSFEFSALDYNIPGKNSYAYRMKGFDKGWINSGKRRFATYTNLDAGEYEFTVIGSNNDGIWNTKGKTIKINISPPFWKTFWFKSLSALTVLAASGSVYQSKINRLRRDRKAQEEFTKKLLDTQENERKRIAGELHDSIGQDLLISKNKLQISLNNPDDNEVILKNINEVSDVITDTLKNVREISYSLHPYQIERLGLSKAISSIIDRLKSTVDIKFTVSIDNIDKTLHPESEISIYRIIQECMNNIIRHSKANEVILNVSRGEDSISILIGDDGIGFSEDKLKAEKGKHGFGIQGMMERIRLIKGDMNIESYPGEGTTLNFNIPLSSEP